MKAHDPILDRAADWITHDPDPNTRAELTALSNDAKAGSPSARAELAERFSGPLTFGTAGLRGLLGGGESRMNRAVVLRTTWGLGQYLLAQAKDAATQHGVVIGYDGRHLGRELAEDTACVLAALGIPSQITPRPCSTPLTAFAVADQHAAAGVMVTASHNPPAYNGYKVYWGNGAQIIPPHDKGIAASIAAAAPADKIPRMDLGDAIAKGLVKHFSDEIEHRYLQAIHKLSVRSDGDRSIPIVYTPMHGTGNRPVRIALAEAGFTNVTTVPEQAEPDGDFPTVAFPNPEEKGALDLAYACADAHGVDLVIANDPDVDRLAVAVRGPSGKFVQLTGNQVGALLGHYVLTEGPKATQTGDRLALASLVSSPMLGAICKALGVRYEETLTGFKWIANRAMELEASEGLRFVFGFEEALGYTVGPVVRDKDGISAALIMAELCAVRRAEGKTLLDELSALSRRYGLFVSGQKSITMPGSQGIAQIGEIMRRLRASAPTAIGAFAVVSASDYQARVKTAKDGTSSPIALPASDVLAYELEGGSRIIARPSGTEPKIKFYFDLCEPMQEGETVDVADKRAREKMDELSRAFCALAGVA
ncbi:MAG: phospho-sugar mutase [Byssovorax sp.]